MRSSTLCVVHQSYCCDTVCALGFAEVSEHHIVRSLSNTFALQRDKIFWLQLALFGKWWMVNGVLTALFSTRYIHPFTCTPSFIQWWQRLFHLLVGNGNHSHIHDFAFESSLGSCPRRPGHADCNGCRSNQRSLAILALTRCMCIIVTHQRKLWKWSYNMLMNCQWIISAFRTSYSVSFLNLLTLFSSFNVI